MEYYFGHAFSNGGHSPIAAVQRVLLLLEVLPRPSRLCACVLSVAALLLPPPAVLLSLCAAELAESLIESLSSSRLFDVGRYGS